MDGRLDDHGAVRRCLFNNQPDYPQGKSAHELIFDTA
jgi:hypothetical protein